MDMRTRSSAQTQPITQHSSRTTAACGCGGPSDCGARCLSSTVALISTVARISTVAMRATSAGAVAWSKEGVKLTPRAGLCVSGCTKEAHATAARSSAGISADTASATAASLRSAEGRRSRRHRTSAGTSTSTRLKSTCSLHALQELRTRGAVCGERAQGPGRSFCGPAPWCVSRLRGSNEALRVAAAHVLPRVCRTPAHAVFSSRARRHSQGHGWRCV